MKVGRKRAARRDSIDDGFRAVHRLERTDAKKRVGVSAEKIEQRGERRARRQVPSVGSEVHAGERDLLEAGRRDSANLLENLSRWQALRGPAGRRNDAVRTGLRAAGLYAQRERRPPGNARLDRRAAAAVAPAEAVGRGDPELVEQQWNHACFLAVGHY